MTDLKFAFRQLLKNPGFTVHPPQCRRPDWVQFPQCCSRKPGRLRQYCYGGRAVAVLMLALGIGATAAVWQETQETRTSDDCLDNGERFRHRKGTPLIASKQFNQSIAST
jgi:hypothetical protein